MQPQDDRGLSNRSDTPTAAPSSPSPAGPILFYDGDCGLCHAMVQWALRHDPQGRIAFAPLRGDTAAGLLPERLRADNSTVVWYRAGQTRLRSAAAIACLSTLGGVWRGAGFLLNLLPTSVADFGYDFVAARRIRWWGRKDSCLVPPPGMHRRFLP